MIADTRPDSASELSGAYLTDGESHEAPIIVTGSREQLFHLLAEAAEVEHCLMCSYLYTAFSLRRSEGEGLTAGQLEIVTRWREAILGVAIEEMGHLLMLANLATALGGRPHFSRPNFPVAPGHFPSDVVVRLAGFSLETIDHFIFLERPQGSQHEDPPAYVHADYSRRQVHLGLMPNAQHYSTIGFLYEAIRENLVGLADRLGEAALFIGGIGSQLGPPLVDMPGIESVASLEAALAAVDLIVEQGEGSPHDRDGTHYRTFLTIREEYLQIANTDPGFRPAWAVVNNPVLRSPPEPDDKVFIDHPDAAPLLDVGCAAYGLLLRLLVQCFSEEGAGGDRQERLFRVALEMMHILADCGAALAELPASESLPEVNAGLSFTMLRGVEPLRPGVVGEQLLAEEIERFIQGATQVERISDAVRRRMSVLAL